MNILQKTRINPTTFTAHSVKPAATSSDFQNKNVYQKKYID